MILKTNSTKNFSLTLDFGVDWEKEEVTFKVTKYVENPSEYGKYTFSDFKEALLKFNELKKELEGKEE